MQVFKILCAILSLFSTTLIQAQTKEKATINFHVNGPRESAIRLFRIENGMTESLGFQRPDEEGKCTFDIDIKKEGIYYFAKAGGKSSDFNYAIYLKKGDNKQIDLFLDRYAIDYDSCSIHKKNKETIVLQKWTNEFNRFSKASKNKQSNFYTDYVEFAKNADLFLKKNKTSNKAFNKVMAEKIQTDVLYFKAAKYFNFSLHPNTVVETSESVKAFYAPLLDKSIVSNPTLLSSEQGQQLLNFIFAFWSYNEFQDLARINAAKFSENLQYINNDDIKVAYLLQKLPKITKYEDFQEQIMPFKDLFKTEKQKAAYDKKYEDLYLYAKGTPGYNFSLQDVNGKTYTLESFRGKVLIIDMWAMWCAPCLAEKPIMEHIAETFYKDREDIEFVGVSVDGLNRRDIWKNFVEKKGFTTIELLSNATESIQKYYKIEGIPRFLIFDKEGKIVTVDAPRPSNPGFKKIVDEALNIK